MTKNPMLLNPSKTIIILTNILVAAAIFYFASRTYVDPDLWWHLKCGIEICQSHIIPMRDPYSFFTFDWQWINEEWLFQLIIGYIYLNCGWCGLVIFKTIVSLSIIVIVYLILKQFTLDVFGKGLFLLLTAILLSPATNAIRPHIVTCLFLGIIFFSLRNFPKHSGRLILLPFIFLPWVNIHGGFIVGILTLLSYAVLYTLLNQTRDTTKSKIFLWIITIICCFLSLANPYGIKLPQRVLSLCTYPHPDISEWQPIELVHGLGPIWATVLIVSILSLIFSKEAKNLVRILLWFPFAIAPMISIRHIPFLGMASVILIGEHIAYIWNKRPQSKDIKTNWGMSEVLFAALCITVSGWLIVSSLSFYAKPQIVYDQDIPAAAAGLIKRVGIKGNLLLNFDWGGYAIWHLSPELKVSFDGRREWAYSPMSSVSNMLFTSGEGDWDYILNKFPIAAVLISKHLPAYNLMKLKPGWKIAYSDEIAAIFLPVDSPRLLEIRHILSGIPIEKRTEQLALPIF